MKRLLLTAAILFIASTGFTQERGNSNMMERMQEKSRNTEKTKEGSNKNTPEGRNHEPNRAPAMGCSKPNTSNPIQKIHKRTQDLSDEALRGDPTYVEPATPSPTPRVEARTERKERLGKNS